MLDVSYAQAPGDAHVIQFPDQKVFVIDLGSANRSVVSYLKKAGINRIEAVIITHFHYDHYEGIFALLRSGIAIGKVYWNPPHEEICRKEEPWGCRINDIKRVTQSLLVAGVPAVEVRAGDTLYSSGVSSLRCLYAYNGINTPFGKTDINDTSVILKLVHGNVSALLTGDANAPLGKYLAVHGEQLKSDILKVPHHGVESVAPNEFFDAVHAKTALVPTSVELWSGERAKRIRQYFERNQTDVFVNGIHGDIEVVMEVNAYRVINSRPTASR